jgi:pimeloyl-ACP methyl ester carboxylesterase
MPPHTLVTTMRTPILATSRRALDAKSGLSSCHVNTPGRPATALAALLLLVLGACGRPSPVATTAKPAGAAPAWRAVLVVFEGYNNCNDGLGTRGTYAWARLAALRDDLRRAGAERVDQLVSCYGTRAFDLRYADDELGTSVRASGVDEVLDAVRRIATRDDLPTDVHVVGHSHGGWLAMRLALDTTIPIASLTTVDPISYPLCQPEDIAQWALGSLLTYRDNPGCQGAPPDLAPRFGDVRRRVGRWSHYWQDEFIPLHSGPIGAATGGGRLGYGFSPMDPRAHEDIKTDARVWADVRAGVVARAGTHR